ncbi:MAG: PEP-CTERM sorting domain-containing protein, partial [Crocosphaera sp.]
EADKKRDNITPLKVASTVGILGVFFAVVALANSANYQPPLAYDNARQDILISSSLYHGSIGLREKYNSLINNYHDHTRQDILISSYLDYDPVELKRLNYRELNDSITLFSPHMSINDYDKNFMYISNFDRDSISSDLYILEDKDLFYDYIIAFGSPDVETFAVAPISNGMALSVVDTVAAAHISSVRSAVPEPSNLISLGFVSVLGLGLSCKRQKNKKNNNNNDLQKESKTIPPISNLNFVIDDSKINKTETLCK